MKSADFMVVVTAARHQSSVPRIRLTRFGVFHACATAAGVPADNSIPGDDAVDAPRSPPVVPPPSKVKDPMAGGSMRRAASSAALTSPALRARQKSAAREREFSPAASGSGGSSPPPPVARTMRASSDGMAVPWLTLGVRLLMPDGECGVLLEL